MAGTCAFLPCPFSDQLLGGHESCEDSREDMAPLSRPHGTRDFDDEMATLQERLKVMAERCRRQLHLALDVYGSGSSEALGQVEQAEPAVDDDEKALDALVLHILACRQPVASDLRMLTATLKIVTDLERIGDDAVDIARTAASASRDHEAAWQRLRTMGERVEDLLATAVDSLLGGNAKAAEEVQRAESQVAALYEQVVGDAVAFTSRHPSEVGCMLGRIAIAKRLAGVARHASNIAQGALFVLGDGMPR